MLISEEIYTHQHLWDAASLMLKESLKEENLKKINSFYFLLSALLMSYMAFEAFINFAGYIILPKIWANEKTYFKGRGNGIETKISKLIEVLADFQWKKGERPYQSIRNLKNFRDMVVHGKVKNSTYEAILKNDGTHIKWEHDWDAFITIDQVKIFMDDIKSFCQSLLESMRKKTDHPHLIFDAFEGPLGSARGRTSK